MTARTRQILYNLAQEHGSRMNNIYRLGALFLCFSWTTICINAQQQPPATPAIAASPGGNDHRILLDIVVTDKSGKPVAGLQQQDFTILDNKTPANILAIHPHIPPPAPQVDASTEIILIIDEVNETYDKVIYARQGVKNFLRQNNGELNHPVALAFFTESGLNVQTRPSVDGNAIADAIDKQTQAWRMHGEGTGFYGAEDRLKMSKDALDSLIAQERSQPGRKMVIWISAGWPLFNETVENLSANQQQHVFDSAVALSTALRQARITFYSVDPLGADTGARTVYYQNFTKPLYSPAQAEMADLGLQVLVTQTGGRAIFGNDTILSSINHCVADLNAFYTLFLDAASADHPNQFHELTVKLAPPGLKARTRNGYYAQP